MGTKKTQGSETVETRSCGRSARTSEASHARGGRGEAAPGEAARAG